MKVTICNLKSVSVAEKRKKKLHLQKTLKTTHYFVLDFRIMIPHLISLNPVILTSFLLIK